jgi:multidrug efflux system membrane fusion protein
MSSKVLTRWWVVVSIPLFMVGCSKPVPTEEAIRAVKVITVGVDNFQSGAEYAGEVRPRIESRLGFRVSGKVTRRYVEVGQQVQAGQVLAQLDPQDYKLTAEAARAQLSAATTNRDLAAADFKRFKDLREQNFISGAELERREANLKAAQAQFDQAQAQSTGQGNQASYTTLTADIAGVVTAVDAEPGQVVAAGTPVVRIAHNGPRDVLIAVPEDKIALIKNGSSADVQPWSTKTVYKGVVREVAASADAVTRTFMVKIALEKAELPLGSTVSVRLQSLNRSNLHVIKLPISSLTQNGQASAVWVVDKDTMTIKQQPVQVATADGNDIVIASGLEQGMMVVSTGVHVLTPGQKVTLYQPKVAPEQTTGVTTTK